jgi:hypothetical protein
MKTLKGLVLGSAGAAVLLTAGTVAQAADAPVAAKGREPVYRCDTAGFIEYPGSDVCFKVGGRAQAWMGAVSNNDAGPEGINFMGITANPTSNHDRFFMGALGRLNVDIRSASEWGLVRAFIEGEMQDANVNTGGVFALRHAFVQVGNVTFGKTWSTFFAGASPEMFGVAAAIVPPPGEVPLRVVTLRYTHNIGNGVSVSISLEDPARHDPFTNPVFGGQIGMAAAGNVAPSQVPDVVANLSARGSWGRFQLSLAAHDNVYRTTPAGPSGSKWGWAGQAALVLNVPNMGQDTFHLVAGYHNGADWYMTTAYGTGGARPSVGLTATGSVDTVDGWFVTGGYRHFWSPTLRSTIAVNYTEADWNNILFVGGPFAGVESSLQVWGNLIWSPVPQLDLGVEVLWGEMAPGVLNAVTGGYASGPTNDIWGAHITARRAF